MIDARNSIKDNFEKEKKNENQSKAHMTKIQMNRCLSSLCQLHPIYSFNSILIPLFDCPIFQTASFERRLNKHTIELADSKYIPKANGKFRHNTKLP